MKVPGTLAIAAFVLLLVQVMSPFSGCGPTSSRRVSRAATSDSVACSRGAEEDCANGLTGR
jgi:hypothetical protein